MADIPESVKKCLAILSAANNDTEKFAALFMVTKIMRGSSCTPQCKKLLLEGIGFKFLKRLLVSQDVPPDCPSQVYKSVALSILSCFCSEPELAIHPEMLSLIQLLLLIVQQADTDDFDDNLIIVSEAYECLESIVAYEPGRKALSEAGAITIMSEIYSQQSFQTDSALRILVTLVDHLGSSSWDSVNPKPFHALLSKIALDFETDQSERKFELCDIMQALLVSCPKSSIYMTANEETWPASIFKGLTDILTSKIGKAQRDPALKLASVMIDLLGIEWTLTDETKPKQFFLLLVHLCSVEVRMQLEDRNVQQIFKSSDLLSACFLTLESAVSYIASDSLELDQKEKQQLYTALKGGFSAIINTLIKISPGITQGKITLELKEKLFICAIVRVLAAWLAQETSAMRNAIYTLLPFIFSLANETFYAYRTKYVSEKIKQDPKGGSGEESSKNTDPLGELDILRLMLPAMTHLTIEDKGRQIMLECKEDQVLLECFTFHWSIVHYKKPIVPKSERLKVKKEQEPELSKDLIEDMKLSRTAMISLCNIFMNITVLEPKLAEESPVFSSLLKFIFNNLPELKNNEENLVLHGNMAILGLLLLKQQAQKVKKNDFSICRYIQSTIRFLWDAYNVDEAAEYPVLVVSMPYKKNWIELMELWFLGMQTMSSVLTLIPWISEFAIESGWAQGILSTLKTITVRPKKGVPPNTKSAYEDLLCNLVDANPSVAEVLKEHDALTVCRNHQLMELGKRLFGD